GHRLRAALQAIAEPHLLNDVESAYVVAGKRLGSRATLAVLDRVLLQRALELLRRLKLAPESATPEQLTLALNENRWRVRLDAGYGCVRMGEWRGMACSPVTDGEPPVELRLALEQAGEARPQAIEVEGMCDTEAWSKALGVPVMAAAAGEARADPAQLELLQYEFAPHVVDWRAWRAPVALAVLCALTWVVGLNVDAWLMLREERALRARMQATFRDAFPRVPVVLDPLQQMRRGVADLKAGSGSADARDFLPLAAALARALPGEAEVVRSLEFRDYVLRVDLEPRALDSPKKREALLEQLGAAGLNAAFAENILTLRAKGGAGS
ncbi:MAG TPA: type II secretion system protein GspL, partial [Burkholderiales bacterium]|nr:type II secretion system protein GspL [Burkholderiales bacterium]